MMGTKYRLNGFVFALSLIWLGSAPLQVMAARNQFLLMEDKTGIATGDSTDAQHQQWSDVDSYGLSLENVKPGCVSVITKKIDRASPFLWSKVSKGTILTKAILEAVDGIESRQVVFRSTMINVKVKSVVTNDSSDKEAITLLPQSIFLEVIPTLPDGRAGIPVIANVTCP